MKFIDFLSGAMSALFGTLGWVLEIPAMLCYFIADMFYVEPENNEEENDEE